MVFMALIVRSGARCVPWKSGFLIKSLQQSHSLQTLIVKFEVTVALGFTGSVLTKFKSTSPSIIRIDERAMLPNAVAENGKSIDHITESVPKIKPDEKEIPAVCPAPVPPKLDPTCDPVNINAGT